MAPANGRWKRWIRILHILAMKGPLNPYKTWTRLIKEELTSQPTIRGDLEELLERGLVKTIDTDQKARGGRPSDYYDLTFLGLSTLVVYRENLRDLVEDPHQFARHVAEKYCDLLPSVFNLWPEFVKENAEELAWRELKHAFGSVTDSINSRPIGSENDVKFFFFSAIRNHLVYTNSPEHSVWVQVLGRNQTIAEELVSFAVDGLSEDLKRWNEVLHVLSAQKIPFESPGLDRVRRGIMDLLKVWPGGEARSNIDGT